MELDNINIKYQSFDYLKRKKTKDIYRPSFNTSHIMNCKLKRIDIEVSNSSKPVSDEKLPKYLWQANNVRSKVVCQNCDKPRCIFAWKDKNVKWKESLENLDSIINDPLYDYTCGDAIFGMKGSEIKHPLNTKIFHIRQFLTCRMNIEKLYFQVRNKSLCFPICSLCGKNNFFVMDDIIMKLTKNRKALPIYINCFNGGKKPIAIGRSFVKDIHVKKGIEVNIIQKNHQTKTEIILNNA